MESVKEILNCVQQGISTGEIDPNNAASGSKDSEVINILGNLVALHEPLQIHIDHLLDSNPLLDYLSRVMEDDAVLVSLRELASSLNQSIVFEGRDGFRNSSSQEISITSSNHLAPAEKMPKQRLY